MQAWVTTGIINFHIAWWLPHLLISVFGLILIYYRQNKSITLMGRYKRWTNSRNRDLD